MVKHLEGKSFEVTLIIGHLRDDVDATHPLGDVVLLFKLGLEDIFREDQHALDLAKHLQIVARDLVTAEVSLTLQRVVEHWQDSVLHLVLLTIDLLRSRLRLQMQTLRNQHLAHTLSYWSNFLIKHCEQTVQLSKIVLHV